MKKEYYVQPYEYNAFADAVISEHPDYEAWNMNNYIHTFITNRKHDNGEIYVDYLSGTVFGLIPILKIEDLSPEKLTDPQQIYERVKDGIKHGLVYYTFLDHFYFPFSQEYQRVHDAHDVMICSLNDNNFGYVENIRGAYHLYTVDEEKLRESFLNCKNNCVFELSPDLNNHFEFDIDSFKQMVFDYMNSRKPDDESIYFHENGFYSDGFFEPKKTLTVAYGIDAYALLVEYMSKRVESKQMVDYRGFYLLREHKHNMIGKLEYLVRHNYLDSEKAEKLITDFRNIEHRLNLMMCKVVKYDFKFSADAVEGVAEEMSVLAEEEKRIFADLYKCL